MLPKKQDHHAPAATELSEINHSSGQLVLGVDLGGTKIYGAVANVGGEVLHEQSFVHRETQAESSVAVLSNVVDQLLAFVRTTGLPLTGMAIGVPGIVQPRTGVVDLAPAFGWTGFPLGERLRARYPYPLLIENDVNLAALGEAWFGHSAPEAGLALITIGTGIGAGIVIDGAVHHGAHNMAGEVGYFLPDRSYLGQAFPGFGALEQLASGSGIARRARQVLEGIRPASELESLTAEAVFEATRQGEAWAKPVVADTVDYLAQLIAAITLIFDPEVVVLGGGVARSADLLVDPIRRRLEGTLPLVPSIRVTQLGSRASMLGGIVPFLPVASARPGRL